MNPTTQQQNSTDMDALNLTHSIALSESGDKSGKPNYNATGLSGEHGAYQWMPGNFEAGAKSAGLDPNDFSPINQDKVAYAQIKEYKDKGYDPGQIASLWNSGSPNNWQNHTGINKQGVKYDTPAYVNKVKQNYQQLKGTQGFNPTPYSNPSNGNPKPDNSVANLPNNPPPVDTLGSELKNRGTEAVQGINSIVGGKAGTGQTRVSGLVQTAGAVAGALGDVVNKGLELIPGVKQIENLLGQGIGALAKTSAGQSVMKSVQEFSSAHPELSKDIGAAFNIVTAIPILRGLGVVGKLGMEAGSQALKGIAEKSFTTGASDLISSTKTGARFLSRNPEVTKDMLDRRLIGDIKGGQYVTKDAVDASWKTITDSNKKIDLILKDTYKNKITIGTEDPTTIIKEALSKFPNSNFTPDKIISNGRKLTPQNGKLWDKFVAGNASLADINKLRSDLATAVKSVYTTVSEPPITKDLGATLAESMSNFVKAQAPETVSLFEEMTKQFRIQKALSYMEGKSIQPGGVAKIVGHTVGAGAGGVVGGMVGGAPGAMIGGLIGDRTAGTISKALTGRNITQGVLKRTGVNAVKVSKKEMATKLPGLFSGAVNVK